MGFSCCSGRDLTVTPGDRADHLQQATSLCPPVSSSNLLHRAQAAAFLFLFHQSTTRLLIVVAPAAGWLISWQSLADIDASHGSEWVSMACLFCAPESKSVGGTVVAGHCLPSSFLSGLCSGRQSSVCLWPTCAMRRKEDLWASSPTPHCVTWKIAGLCLSSSSYTLLPGFDLICRCSRHKTGLATKPGIKLG